MNEKLKANAIKFKNHVVRQKYAYGYATLAVLAMALVVRNNRGYTAFLEEKGINPMEFYTPEYFEELQK